MKPLLVEARASTRRSYRPLWAAALAALLALLGLLGPLSTTDTALSLGWLGWGLGLLTLLLALSGQRWSTAALLPLGLLGALLPVMTLTSLQQVGGWGYWFSFWGFWLLAVIGIGHLSSAVDESGTSSVAGRLRTWLPPAVVPLLLLLLWQALVIGYGVPVGVFPGVIDVWDSLTKTMPVLLRDAYVTFVKEVLLGLAIGLVTGFAVGVAIAYSLFLQRGFLPLAAAFGAVPIVGLAPVLGRAFGVDWHSKAAVVVIVTFFPVVLNTVQGLTSVEALKLELLKAYAASPRDILIKLRIPNALPYLFNALKLAAVLSIISVIVAEFLIPGPPEGLGQRISLSAHQGAYDVTFAAIVVSSLISLALYGLLSLLERQLTKWHASYREEG